MPPTSAPLSEAEGASGESPVGSSAPPLRGVAIDRSGRVKVSGVLADQVFGPVHSRRYGVSLGINLLPAGQKVCSFDCLYCECGRTPHPYSSIEKYLWPDASAILSELEERIRRGAESPEGIDAVTFAGNGEPTLHPRFREIAEGVVGLCRNLGNRPRVIVLTNGSHLSDPHVDAGLRAVDEACFKLDSGGEQVWKELNHPQGGEALEAYVERLAEFPRPVIQTLFVRGSVDNTTEEEVKRWMTHVERIRPVRVDVYSLDRPAPTPSLEQVPLVDLEAIAEGLRRRAGTTVRVFGEGELSSP